ncbi:hypothetical protein V1T75_12300 [Tenacibaculum sp. FZY0031]|uniref:hypothetical protein n=1 Tax=unclassified Tenacibaculum TaxID=2635139 RepID=UPI002E994ECA|nr:hypothetical protein [Tenacibaculum sp. FZY0031]
MKNKYLIILSFFLSVTVFSQKKEFVDVNIDKLIGETQMSNSSGEIEVIWWIPTEFWQVALSRDRAIADNEKELMINTLKEYVFVVFIKGKVGVFGGVTYVNKELIEQNATVFYNGNRLKKLKNEEIPSDLQNMVGFMKPMMKNMLGQMGENMQFIVFKNNENSVIDPYKEGNLTFNLFKFKPEIELPLGSLLMEKKCVEGNKLFNGKWNYCPYHGKGLVKQ